ncbi:hypothetical protein B0T22DRAFT_484772 [Podospora appendiculata]|uniref:Uncharacterized protein n=1 Tax=Podospora appendiculata TaxID=314037 RepID=A0AAE0X213_9PEZI|nr:hypothetical protein B0T22DRAFT_484772 [Podospora appendiculata]
MPLPGYVDSGEDLLKQLGEQRVLQLAPLLRLPRGSPTDIPSADWLAQQKKKTSQANYSGLRSRSCARWLAKHIPPRPSNPPGPSLCPSHRRLDYALVVWCYARLRQECAACVNCVRAFVKQHHPRACPGVVARHVQRMSCISTLYMAPREFDDVFGPASCAEGERFRRVASGCPACVLAAVGGRGELLVALRANLVASVRPSIHDATSQDTYNTVAHPSSSNYSDNKYDSLNSGDCLDSTGKYIPARAQWLEDSRPFLEAMTRCNPITDESDLAGGLDDTRRSHGKRYGGEL